MEKEKGKEDRGAGNRRLMYHDNYYCPKEGCEAYDSHLKVPLIETLIDNNHSSSLLSSSAATLAAGKNRYKIECPYCSTQLFNCENCFSLTVVPQQKIQVGSIGICRKCGFHNILEQEVRNVLDLSILYPLTEEGLVEFHILNNCI